MGDSIYHTELITIPERAGYRLGCGYLPGSLGA